MIELLTKKLLNTNLEDPDLLLGTERYKSNKILPEANVIKIGGQSFMDRGRKAVFPLIEEIKENLPKHQMIIGTGSSSGRKLWQL